MTTPTIATFNDPRPFSIPSPIGTYLLFCGEAHLTQGGWKDLFNSYVTLEQALTAAETLQQAGQCDWWHIVDITKKKIVISGNHMPAGVWSKVIMN